MHHHALTQTHSDWLADTFARNAQRYSGWTMEADPSDTPPPSDPPPAGSDDPPDTPPADLGDAGKKALDAMKLERNDAKQRATKLEKELETLRKQSMSDAEKAVAEAEERSKSTATQAFGKRLAQADIKAAAATAQADLTGVFEYLDLGRFVGDDGEPNAKAIEAFVAGLPSKTPGTPSFQGGPRTPAAPARAGSLEEALTERFRKQQSHS